MDLLLLAKATLDESRRLRGSPAPSRADMSLLLMHDAVEFGVVAAAYSVGVKIPKNGDLGALWGLIAEKQAGDPSAKLLPPHDRISRLEKARAHFKHHGGRPSHPQLADFDAVAYAFLAELSRTFFGVEFEQLSEVDLVSDAVVRSLLKRGEQLAEAGHADAALCFVAEAITAARGLLAGAMHWPGWQIVFDGVGPQDRRVAAHLESLGSKVAALQFYVEANLIGIHPSERGMLDAFLPRSSTGRTYAFRTRETAPATAAQCVRSATRFAIAVQRYVDDAGFASWFPRDAPPSYVERYAPGEGYDRQFELPSDDVLDGRQP